MKTSLLISGLSLNFYTGCPLIDSESCRPFVQTGGSFCCPDDSADITFTPVKALPPRTSPALYQGLRCQIYKGEEGLARYYTKEVSGGIPYAYSRNNPDGSVRIFYLEEQEEQVNSTLGCLIHCGFEEILINHRRMILHSSCIRTQFGGILFSGHSGIGKSTQADLWKQYESAEIINGDRTILYQKDRQWMGAGSPYAGSSRYFVNKQVPLRAVVMLDQSETCSIRKLGSMEAFRSIYSELLINSWNHVYMETICDMCREFIMEIPVYRMACTPDKNAVEMLKSVLEN